MRSAYFEEIEPSGDKARLDFRELDQEQTKPGVCPEHTSVRGRPRRLSPVLIGEAETRFPSAHLAATRAHFRSSQLLRPEPGLPQAFYPLGPVTSLLCRSILLLLRYIPLVSAGQAARLRQGISAGIPCPCRRKNPSQWRGFPSSPCPDGPKFR